MKINDQHRLMASEPNEDFRYHWQPTPNLYSPPEFKLPNQEPDSIIIHYTAMTSAQSAANALCNPKVKASAHLVVGKQGEIFQLAPFNYRTWHAGVSEYGGRKYYNHFAIGIEIDNVGWLIKMGQVYSRPELLNHGTSFSEDEIQEAQHRNPRVHHHFWQRYTREQILKVYELCELLAERYPIKEILGHDEISPGRKQDPGPLFPIEDLRNQVLNEGRFHGSDDDLNFPRRGKVNASKLNIRTSPNGELAALPLLRGTDVLIHEEKDGWYRVSTDLEGWVSKKFVE